MKSIIYIAGIGLLSCTGSAQDETSVVPSDTIGPATLITKQDESVQDRPSFTKHIQLVSEVSPDSIVSFAKSLIGVPYLYASTDPARGFDCSGFITYVFNHFDISVPRSSVDFTNYGKEISKEQSRPGDLILFTGTDSTVRVVGHMGIIVANDNGELSFIHSSSGKANGVVITPLGKYYLGRFVKVIRVFPDSRFRN